jgi:hypothetical protein
MTWTPRPRKISRAINMNSEQTMSEFILILRTISFVPDEENQEAPHIYS